MKHLLIAYILSDISVRNRPNRFMYVKVVARQSSDIFETQCAMQMHAHIQYACGKR